MTSLDHAHALLATTEPLEVHTFTAGDDVRFHIEPGWQHGNTARAGTDTAAASIRLPSTVEYPLTFDAVLEAAAICGLPRAYTARCPANLLEPQLNFWFRDGLTTRGSAYRDHHLLAAAGIGAAVTRARHLPFSNLGLLAAVTEAITVRHPGTTIAVDPRLVHTLRRTHVRLVLPDLARTVDDGQTWVPGIQIRNSLTGSDKTSVDGFLVHHQSGGAAIDRATSGAWSRRQTANDEDVYGWARGAVTDVLAGVDSTVDAIGPMAHAAVDDRNVSDVVRDLFAHYRIPVAERTKIIERIMVADDAITLATILSAIVATTADDDIDPDHLDSIMRMAGDFPHSAQQRCDACLRMIPH